MTIPIEYPTDWETYELIDSGEGEKLERFNTYTLVRPDPRAIWMKHSPDAWNRADANFRRTDPKTGEWIVKTPPPIPWTLTYKKIEFILRPTEFKHVGVFPEQAVNWDWLAGVIAHRPLKVLNLFAYTGGATMAALSAGASVTHVDAAKSTITWAKENLAASGLSAKPVRWIEDDVMKFIQREAKRGNTYDGIIMDPPRFGHGVKGEVWKLEHDLPDLYNAAVSILSPGAEFMLLNAYTADISSVVLSNLFDRVRANRGGSLTTGELALKETLSGRLLPNGIFSRWLRENDKSIE